MATFGENLKRIRKSKGFTQAKLAELIGQTQACVSKWETGDRHPFLKVSASRNAIARYEKDEIFPKYANLSAIAQVLDCTVSELLGEEPREAVPSFTLTKEEVEVLTRILDRWQAYEREQINASRMEAVSEDKTT